MAGQNMVIPTDDGKTAYKALIEGGSSGFAAQLGGWRGRYLAISS